MHSDIFVCFWTEKPFVWLAQTLFEAIFWHGSTINECEEWPIACRSKKPGKIWCCRSIWVHYSREKVRLYSSFRFHLRWTSHYCPFSEKVIVFFLQFYSLAQYQSSLTAAVEALNQNQRNASFQVVGYLVEELRDESTYKAFCKDLEDANIFIGSFIFVEELALKVKDAVEKERERLDAVLVFRSMPEVMRLNKLGSFSMSQLGQSKSPFFQLFKRKKQSAGFAESMLS